MRYIIFILLCGLIHPAFAEVFECEGKWTNKPCSGKVTRSIEEAGSSTPVDEGTKLLRDKTGLLHEVRMKALSAKENFDIRYELGAVENFCLKTASTLDECDKKVKEADSELDKKISAASTLASQKRNIELQEEANRLQQERNKIEQEKATVVVQERQPLIIIPRDRIPHIHSGVSGSISVQGNVSGSNVNVGISGHEHSDIGHTSDGVIIVPRDRPAVQPHQGSVTVYDKSGKPRTIEGVKPGPFAR